MKIHMKVNHIAAMTAFAALAASLAACTKNNGPSAVSPKTELIAPLSVADCPAPGVYAIQGLNDPGQLKKQGPGLDRSIVLQQGPSYLHLKDSDGNAAGDYDLGTTVDSTSTRGSSMTSACSGGNISVTYRVQKDEKDEKERLSFRIDYTFSSDGNTLTRTAHDFINDVQSGAVTFVKTSVPNELPSVGSNSGMAANTPPPAASPEQPIVTAANKTGSLDPATSLDKD